MKQFLRFVFCAVLCLAVAAANLCFVSAADKFDSKAEMLQLKSHIEDDAGQNAYSPVQGACTDGRYAYFAVTKTTTTIVKYDLRTWEYVSKQNIINMGHSNDMTYNSDKNYIVVANNKPYYDYVTLIDPDTLDVIKDVKIDEEIYAIAYNPKRKSYVVGISGGYDYAILDSDFKLTEKFKGVNTGYTRQGCDCDDDYVYFVQSGGRNNIAVYDYSGKHIANIPMTNTDEAENMFHVGRDYYVSMYYYGSSVHRVGFSDSTRIRYTVSYDSNGGEGAMAVTSVHYGESTPLRRNAYTRDGYFFAGWTVQRDSDGRYLGYAEDSDDYGWLSHDEIDRYFYYGDGQSISKTVDFGGIKLCVHWINERYGVDFSSGGGYGELDSVSVGYSDEFTLPESPFGKEGYIFDGYVASRDTDGKVFGYREGRGTPEWLSPSELSSEYIFREGDSLSKLTEDGRVTFEARYKFAYTFGEDGSTLVEYVGVDEKVNIPSNEGELRTLAEGAIKDNSVMTELYIPASVSSLQRDAVTNCPKLRSVYFEGSLPEEFDSESVSGSDSPAAYKLFNGQAFCIGFFADKSNAQLIRAHAANFDSALKGHIYER